MGDEQKATFEYSAAFRLLSGETVKVELSQLILTDEDLRLSGEVDPATFMLIEQEMAFNMLPQVKTPHDAATFRAGINVEIELMLRPSLLNAWRRQGITEIEVMMREMFTPDAHNLYLESECWLLTRAVQPVVVNVEEGTFGKAGFQTAWAKGVQPESSPRDLVLQYLDEKGWSYDPSDEGVLRIFVGTDAGRWILLIDVVAERHLVLCLSVYPNDIPEARRSIVAGYLFNVNYSLTSGNFEMDEDDGDLRFRTSLVYGSSPVGADMIAYLIEHNIGTMGSFYAQIEQLAQT